MTTDDGQGAGKASKPAGSSKSVLGDLAKDGAQWAAGASAKDAVEGAIGESWGDSFIGKKAKEVVGGLASVAAKKVVGVAAGAIATALANPIEPVSYEVRVEGGPDLDWHVRRFHLVEGISEPYEMALDLVSDQVHLVDLIEKLVGANLVLEYGRNGFSRQVCGIIEQVDFVGVESDRMTVRLRVVPALTALAQRMNMRHFQDMDVPKILQEVLEPALEEYGRKLDKSKLNDKGYLVRDYCVQYGESDLAFVHRLMEEEGISYFFDVDEDKGVEIMVLADQNEDEPNSDFPRVEGIFEGSIPIIADRAEQADSESLRYLDWQCSEHATKVTTRRFNWKRPDPDAMPESEQERKEGTRDRKREIYAPDDRRRIEDRKDDDGYEGTDVTEDEDERTKKFFQMLTSGRERGQGASNATGMRAGGVFEMDDHPHPNVAYHEVLVTRVVHFGDCPDEELGGGGGGERYQNSFECIPVHAVFRPSASTARARIYGAQTATVVGPEGEEIHTDAHGRIKVKFHWDRDSPADASASCWVRVAQMWGGSGWGTLFLPRIGMEVVVQFLDGNPDRPLVVGCVYNGTNKPPVELPAKKTHTTIKTNSSKGGGGFNELRFEDLKGEEKIYVHAQKDLTEEVLNNRTRSVGGNESVVVNGNRFVTVKGAGGGEEGAPPPGQAVDVTGQHRMHATEEVLVNSDKEVYLHVGDTYISIKDDRIELKTTSGAHVLLTGTIIHLNP